MTTEDFENGLWAVASSDTATGTERMVALVALAEINSVSVPESLTDALNILIRA